MSVRAPRSALVALAIAAAGGRVGAAQDSEVKSMAVRVAAVSVPTTTIAVENRSTSPLVELRLAVSGPEGVGVYSSNFLAGARASEPGTGPIAPGERRTITIETPGALATVRPALAAFANGNLEGDPAAIDEVVTVRRQRVAALRYWIAALNAAPADDASLHAYVQARIEESARMTPDDPSGLRNQLAGYVNGAARGTGWLHQVVVSRRDSAARELTALTMPGGAISPGPVTSIAVDVQRRAGARVVAYLENLRDVPAQAWEVEFAFPDAPNRPIMGHRADGPYELKRHEVAEVLVYPGGQAPSVLPVASVRMVLFADGTFEGSRQSRDEVLASRAREEQDLAYWIQALNEDGMKPSSDAASALRDRVLRRKQDAAAAQRPETQADQIAQLANQIERTPDRQAAIVGAVVATMERRRQTLVRLTPR
ncbi:MAG TPA: hypothetical protein VLT86_03420 [Vicinamibacterales bacterium]|nr:hypothetical protein [Vicinamibacterales bacterium]